MGLSEILQNKFGFIELPINILTLQFRDRDVEARYTETELVKALPVIRLALSGGFLIYALFGILDYYIVPEIKEFAWFIRFGIVGPLFFLTAISTLHGRFYKYSQQLFAFCMLMAGGGIIAMIAFADAVGGAAYFAGLVPVMVYCCCIPPVRFIYASVVTIIFVSAYEFTALYFNPLPASILLSNNFFLVSVCVMTIFASYIQEIARRRDFVNMELLEQERERSVVLADKAEAANHAKSEFLAVMSHELRTPLNAIIGFSEILKKEMFGPIGQEQYKEYSEDINNSGQNLLSIINDILDLSKAEAGKLVLSESQVQVMQTLSSTLRIVRDSATEKNIRIMLEVPDWDPVLWADPRLLGQVFMNLLSNAIKFTPQGGQITIECEQSDEGVLRIKFTDTGIGIDQQDISKVFVPFAQIESSMSRNYEGTGLGLPLSKNIINLHNGKILLNSQLGKGTTVVLEFPQERLIKSTIEESVEKRVSHA